MAQNNRTPKLPFSINRIFAERCASIARMGVTRYRRHHDIENVGGRMIEVLRLALVESATGKLVDIEEIESIRDMITWGFESDRWLEFQDFEKQLTPDEFSVARDVIAAVEDNNEFWGMVTLMTCGALEIIDDSGTSSLCQAQ